jgi:hypothetical protein
VIGVRSLCDAMTIDLSEMDVDGLCVERFEVREHDHHAFRLGARAPRPGSYTRLLIDGRLWMSDTDAEKRDHLAALEAIRRLSARRVLINGLGLGMVVKAALAFDHVEHVDVVELDKRVACLVGAHYARDPRVVIHHADAYEQAGRWPTGSRWDVAWSDIWPDLCTANLPDMARLRRSYGRRTEWHDCWGRELLLHRRTEERRRGFWED